MCDIYYSPKDIYHENMELQIYLEFKKRNISYSLIILTSIF